jgi:hypothetical protein
MSWGRSLGLRCLMATFTAVTSRVRSSERSNWGGLAIARTTAQVLAEIHARSLDRSQLRHRRWVADRRGRLCTIFGLSPCRGDGSCAKNCLHSPLHPLTKPTRRRTVPLRACPSRRDSGSLFFISWQRPSHCLAQKASQAHHPVAIAQSSGTKWET